MYTFNHADIEQHVIDDMLAAGISPKLPLSITIDGKIHRFQVDGDTSSEKAGAYCIFDDNWPAGWFCNWRNGIKVTWSFSRDRLNNEGKSFFTDEVYKERLKRSEEHQKKLRDELGILQQTATEKARKLWSELKTEATCDFPYLQLKQVGAFGGIKHQTNFNATMYGFGGKRHGELVIPLYNIDGLIQSLQFIDEDGVKRFFSEAPAGGAFFAISLDAHYMNSHPDAPILIGEGYATMATIYRATLLPCVAAMNAGNLFLVAQKIKDKFPGRKIIIMADNDRKPGKTNIGLKKAREARDKLDLQAVIFPPFTDKDYGSDWNDYEALYGQHDTAALLRERINFECLPPKMQDIVKKVGVINAQDLRHKKFDPINWAIDGFIPSGLTVLAGGPKVGKSILALHLALGIAIGGTVLGKIDVEKGDVLYLALEDTERRLKERINGSYLDENCDLSGLDIVTSSPRQDEGGLDYIRYWLTQHNEAKLVIVDTLQKFRKLSKGKLNVYAEDYDTLAELKKVADEFNVAFIVIHHLKKMSAKEEMSGDWINQLSGSIGITGCADTILALKRDRVSTHGTLRRTGRDVEEKDFAMKLDGFGWFLEGEIGHILDIPEWKKKIIEYMQDHEKITPMLLSEYAGITIEAAKKQLQRAVDVHLLKRIEHGVYRLA